MKTVRQIADEIEAQYPPVSEDPEIKRLDALLARLDAELQSVGRAKVREPVQTT